MANKTRHYLYGTYTQMIARCYSPNLEIYKRYGARGIRVCDRWILSFWNFVADMGERPLKHTLDRIDVNGNYEPSNCRWATASQQARNTRNARFLEIEGKMLHVAELQEQSGVNMRTIAYRAQQGMPLEKILSKEPQWNNSESQKKAVAKHAELKRAQTHCKYGHDLSGENVYLYRGIRHCRACRVARDRWAYYGKVKPLEEYMHPKTR